MPFEPPNNELRQDIPTEESARNLETLDEFLQYTQSIGSVAGAISENMHGLNFTGAPSAITIDKENQGYVFFTRPQLNLRSNNIRNVREFYNLLTKEEFNVFRYIRCMLDPRLAFYGFGEYISPGLVDNSMAFIPILSNHIKTLSGWEDKVIPTYTSEEGIRKEQFSMVDGAGEINQVFNLDATFDNPTGHIVTTLFEIWTKYMTAVAEGIMTPYTDFIVEDEKDYETRIYRITLSEDMRFVSQIAVTNASFPLTDAKGKFFDYTNEKTYNDQTKDVTVRFQCQGASYNDPIHIRDFNEVVGIFNPDMRELNDNAGVSNKLVKIDQHLLSSFNYKAYPRINQDTFEMEWYAYSEIAAAINLTLGIDI